MRAKIQICQGDRLVTNCRELCIVDNLVESNATGKG